MRRINIYLSDVQRERLQRLSVNTGLNESELIRRAVDRFLEEEEPKIANMPQVTAVGAQPVR